MALPQTILELRRLVNEATQDPYTDTVLSLRIDAAGGNVRKVAGDIWTEKASSYAELVDVQEGSSRRNLGDLYQQALGMAARFAEDSGEAASLRKSRTRRIVRP